MAEYGDLVVKCHKCGSVHVREAHITDGRAIYLFNKEGSNLKLHCPKCDITMEILIQPSENTEENEELSEEITTEEII